MGNVITSSNNPSKRIQWMWSPNVDPRLDSELNHWCCYSDIENMIIEEAFISGKTHVKLDDYYIDIEKKRQISNNDPNKQRPITRMVCDRDDKNFRIERFIPNPIAPDRSDGSLYGFISPFIKEVVKDLNLTREQLPSKNETIVSMIVEKAARGIIEEGNKIGKRYEAEEIAKYLMKNKTEGIKEVWKCCVYLYSLECFLYKIINHTMQLIGSLEHEPIWRNRVGTLGPFCLLLWDNPFDSKTVKAGTILYRPADFSDDIIAVFKEDCLKYPRPVHSFQAFTSCTRNRNIAENFANANAVFIMELQVTFTIDLSKLSEYVHEEEELLLPGVTFTINKIEFDMNKNKHLIYLTLQQRHSRANQYQTQQNTLSLTQRTKPSSDALDDDLLDRAAICLDNILDRANLDLGQIHYYNRDGVEDDWN